MSATYSHLVCEGIQDLARGGEVEIHFDRILQKVAAALLEDERVFGVKCMKMIKGCLANQRRARRLRIESREDGEVIVLTETGIEFFTYYGTVRALREGDRRLDCLNMNEIKKRTATFEQLLEEIQQVFEEFMPNQVGVLTPEMLADEIQQVFQEIARLSEQTTMLYSDIAANSERERELRRILAMRNPATQGASSSQ